MKNNISKLSALALACTIAFSGINIMPVYAKEETSVPVIDDISIDKQGQTVDVYYDYYGKYADNPQDIFTISVKAHDDGQIKKVEVEVTSPGDENIEDSEHAYSGKMLNKTDIDLKWNENTQSYQGIVRGLYSYRPSIHNAFISAVTVTDNYGNETNATKNQLYDIDKDANVIHYTPKYWVKLDMYHHVSLKEWNEITGTWDYRGCYLKDGTTIKDINNMFKPENKITDLGFKGWQYIHGYLEDDYPIRCGFSLIAQYDKAIVEFDTLSTKNGTYKKNYIKSQYINETNEIKFPKIAGFSDNYWQEDELAPDDVGIRYVLSTDKELNLSDDQISSYIDLINKSNSGDTLTIEMGDAMFAPRQLLDAIREKNITLSFDMNGAKWTINGKQLSSNFASHDTNMSIVKSSCKNETTQIADLLGNYSSEKIEFGEDDAFDIGAQLTISSNEAENKNKLVILNKNGDDLNLVESRILNSTEYTLNKSNAGILYSVYGENGDCSGDDKIDIKDALKALNHVSGCTEMNIVQQGFADVDMNNKVNLQDLTRIIHFVSGRTAVLYEEKNEDGSYDGGGSGQGGSISSDYKPGSGKNPAEITDVNGTELVDYAKKFVGNPYVWGGNSLTSGCDSSGFVHEVFSYFGISTPRYSQAFKSVGQSVSFDCIKSGDVVVYPGHVAIYAGDGKIVEAQSTKAGITNNRNVQCHTILAIRRLL